MGVPVISVRGLGKKYRLGETIRHDTLRDKIAHSFKTLFARNENPESRTAKREINPPSALRHPPLNDFWALKDISFEVQQGEVVGIIGRNGAGKSTLLKILSQITEPTEGEIYMRGRVASLLEVGTGFHPELTGRENIFLNGAILGMARAEIVRKFDEIVAFSEVENFIDTPVKRYSSGMYVRLAFAVAAHLEPEILIVDEVLAVGDATFQKKCIGKMGDAAQEGRTVLFVSHNMAAVKMLCARALMVEGGRLQADAPAEKTVSLYLNEKASGEYLALPSDGTRARVSRLWFSDRAGVVRESFRSGDPLAINVELANPGREALEVDFAFFDSGGCKLWNFAHAAHGLAPITASPCARVRFTFFVPALQIHTVFVHVGLRIKGYHLAHYADHITEGLRFLIDDTPGETYQMKDAIFRCPMEFQAIPDER